MIDWQTISTSDLALLAEIALDHEHGWGISDLLSSLDKLSDEQRSQVETILLHRQGGGTVWQQPGEPLPTSTGQQSRIPLQ